MKLKGDRNSLKRRSEEVTNSCEAFCEEFEQFVLSKKCIALAAPQVGKFIRVIAIKSRNRKKATICINPTIIKASSKTVTKPENCVSLGQKTVMVERPKWVKIKYLTPSFYESKTMLLFGRRAAAACHTIDLLDGKLIF